MTKAKLDSQWQRSSHQDVQSAVSPSLSVDGAGTKETGTFLEHNTSEKTTQVNSGSSKKVNSGSSKTGRSQVPASLKAPQAVIPKVSIQSKKSSRHGLKLAQSFLWGGLLGVTTLVSSTIGATLALVLPLSSEHTNRPSHSQIDLLDIQEHPRSWVDLWRNGLQYHVSRPVNILVMGVDVDRSHGSQSADQSSFTGRSDTMLLVRVDPTSKTLSLLSIPRDTQVDLSNVNLTHLDQDATEVPDYGTMKINQANFLGGPAMAAKVVSKTLNDVPIDRYIRVNTDAFRELVDLLGGLDVFVPAPMQYTDQTQKLHIDLKPGWQTLNGDQAEQFARFRNDGYGDIGRVQRQQALIKALRERLKNPTVITKLPQVLRVMSKYIDTNLSLEEMIALVNFGLELDHGNFKMVMLPGRFSSPSEYAASYWLLDAEGRNRVMQQYFSIQPNLASVDPTATLVSNSSIKQLRIAIQNASGQPNMSRQVADYLISRGFTNVYIGENWPEIQRNTQIIVQRGDQDAANSLSHLLGFGKIELASTGDIESDLTIRVGNDLAQ